MTFCILQAQEIARSTPDPFPRMGVGSGYETNAQHDSSKNLDLTSLDTVIVTPGMAVYKLLQCVNYSFL